MFDHVTNTTPTLSLSEFGLSQAVLEARYLNGFLHWDRAGAIWMEMTTKHFPDLKMVKAEPGQPSFGWKTALSFQYRSTGCRYRRITHILH